MSDASVRANESDARQCMIRFWMAISAVWLTFWLLIAAITLFIVGAPYTFSAELGQFLLILVAPPAVLLGIGMIGSWASHAFAEAFWARVERKQRPAQKA